ncbi:MerR family transcriptional regulator [Pedobacter polaris]|uniref:MerR family transcriptional regulator n=1 Tax=Pedobacter polaris TaxID=2571273 RepID=A0A4U1CS34_9SPHI|nr:MerR family transcriptional regulator [Pedobacter polaris]TKC10513.1 MerR family transcriptional regulator [Pedobacter polaris]
MKLSISDLEQLSGVPVHTIRIWERRYNALEPLRSSGNTRSYNDEHLKRLLNIVSLNQAGVKISQACSLTGDQMEEFLEKELKAIMPGLASFEFYVSQLLNAGVKYDELSFSILLDQCIEEHGIMKTYEQVMFPLLQRLGLMWRLDHICPAHEHFISAIVRQKLMTAINSLPLSNRGGPVWLLFLPEDEAHDIPLLFASFMLRSYGFKVIYLGERVPMESLKDAYSSTQVDHLLFFLVRQRPVKETGNYLQNLSNTFPNANIFLAGNGKLIAELELGANMSCFSSIAEFSQLVKGGNGQ